MIHEASVVRARCAKFGNIDDLTNKVHPVVFADLGTTLAWNNAVTDLTMALEVEFAQSKAITGTNKITPQHYS